MQQPSQGFSQSTPLARKEQVIASILGQPSFEAIDWRTLMKEGVLVRLSIRRCRFSAKLELADLGVSVQEERVRQALKRTLVLGEKRLLPQSYMTALERIESGARWLLKKSSFTTELGAFLPAPAYGSWKEATQGYQERYFALRDEILANHRSIVQQVLAEYEIVAKDTYQRIRETSPDALPEREDVFVTNYCNRIAALIPDQERIKTSFDFVITLVDSVAQLGQLATPSEETLNEDRSRVQGPRLVEPEQVRRENEDRQGQRAAMERDLLRQAQEQKQRLVDSFLTTIVGHLRTLTYEVMTDVLATLQKQPEQRFSPRSVVQLKNLVGQLAQLNFYGDQEIERMMAQVQRVLDLEPRERQRSLAEIGETLRAIATVARATLLDLDEQPRSARDVAIPEFPSEASVRQARMELGLDLDEGQFLQLVDTRAARMSGTLPLWSMPEEEPRAERMA